MAAQSQPWYIDSAELKQMLFPEAAEVWLATRTLYISTKTFHEYELNIRTLSKFFGETKLAEIDADKIRAYQRTRSQQQCGPSGINHECSVLQQMLKRVGLWEEIRPHYEPMPLPKETKGRALSDEEKVKLFEAAQTSTNWQSAFLFAMLSINTSAGPKEIATLRLKDVDLDNRVIMVQPGGAKNVHRVRSIPLNEEAFKAATLAVARAKCLGSIQPEHYLFPFRVHRSLFDPARYQTTFKTAWKRMTAAAGLGKLRMYDLRHHAITVMLEHSDVSEESVEAVAGHISRQMKKRYSHVRLAARRAAVCTIDGSPSRGASEPPRLRPQDALTNEEILDMLTGDGLPPRIVAEKIKKARNCAFDTSRAALKTLKASGVPDSVIVAMVRAS